jgi:hypothetical protein
MNKIKIFVQAHRMWFAICVYILTPIIATIIVIGETGWKWLLLGPLLTNYIFWIVIIIAPILIFIASKLEYLIIPIFFLITGSLFILFATSPYKDLAASITTNFNIQLFALGISMSSLGVAFFKLFEIKGTTDLPGRLKTLATDIGTKKENIDSLEKEWTDVKKRTVDLNNAVIEFNRCINQSDSHL